MDDDARDACGGEMMMTRAGGTSAREARSTREAIDR